MSEPIRLQTTSAEVVVTPALGAAVAHYALADGTPVFRPSPASVRSPFDLACNLMVPWCNRVSAGGFSHGGRFHPLEPNLPDQALPLHGNGFQRDWQVVDRTPTLAEFELISRGPGPFHYEARVRYALHGAALTVDLGVWHWGETPLPYGLGLHPWFEKTADTTLQFAADAVITTDAALLPVGRQALGAVPDWSFSGPNGLPVHGIDNAFSGWPGLARLRWPSRNLLLTVESAAPLRCCHVFTPGAGANFFCFEPTTHLPNAHNWDGAAPDGLTELAQGDGLETRTVFTPGPLA
ncbi:MAG: aldose 1-epimerase [Pseudomonadota bacterium]